MGKSLLSTASLAVVFIALIGCKAATVLDTANRAMDVVEGSNSVPNIGSNTPAPHNYTTKVESIYINVAKRTERNYGNILMSTEKNPDGMTRIRVIGKHLDSGADIKASAYFYPISPEGWLVDKSVKTHDNGNATANSGTYYMKAASGEFYAVGEVTLKRGVTNIVTLEME